MDMQNLIGFLLPPFIDVVNKNIKNKKVKYVVSIIISILIGTLLNLEQLNNPEKLLGNVSLVFVSAQTTYNLYWKKSKLRKKIK